MRRLRDLSARTPLRVRLVVLILGLLAMALAVTGIAGPTLLKRYLVERVDAQLVQTIMPSANDCLQGLSYRGSGHGGPVQFSGFYRQCFDRDGNPLGSPLFNPATSSQSAPTLPATINGEIGKPFTIQGHDDWRMLVDYPRDRDGNPAGPLVLVGVSLNETDGIVSQLVLLEVIMAAMVLVIVGFLAYVLIRSSLRPLVAVERTAEAIADGDLTRRVPETDPRTEVGGLAKALNVMLGQIETAFDERRTSEEAARTSEARMRRFVADASHELRTPLTSIRGFAELYRQNGGDDPAVNRIIGRIEHHATRMGVLVDDLLLLARLDQQRPVERRPVDLLALATDAVVDARVTAPDHDLKLRRSGDEPPVVLGDEVRLRQVLGNLVANAMTHTPAGTEVIVSVRTADGQAIVEVADDGPGMSEEDAARVFERFYRTDPSRTRALGGSGLGLSIVAALVTAHGGTVDLSTIEGKGATFTVRLPLAQA